MFLRDSDTLFIFSLSISAKLYIEFNSCDIGLYDFLASSDDFAKALPTPAIAIAACLPSLSDVRERTSVEAVVFRLIYLDLLDDRPCFRDLEDQLVLTF